MTKKQMVCQNIAQVAQAVMINHNFGTDVYKCVLANGFQSGGTNPIVDADCADFGFTAAQFNSFWSCFTRLQTVINNGTVGTAVDGSACCNAVRGDI